MTNHFLANGMPYTLRGIEGLKLPARWITTQRARRIRRMHSCPYNTRIRSRVSRWFTSEKSDFVEDFGLVFPGELRKGGIVIAMPLRTSLPNLQAMF